MKINFQYGKEIYVAFLALIGLGVYLVLHFVFHASPNISLPVEIRH